MELPFFIPQGRFMCFFSSTRLTSKSKYPLSPQQLDFSDYLKTKKNGFLTSYWPLCYIGCDIFMFYTQSNVSEKHVFDCDF